MELEVTWKHVIRIWWAYFWRSILVIILSTLVGFVIGFTITTAGNIFGSPSGLVNFLSTSLSILAGLALSLLPVKWILGKDFGAFRLVLLSKESPQPTPSNS